VELVDDSRLGTLLVSNSPIFDENGNLVGAVHVAKNMSEIQMLEKELQQKNKILDVVAANIHAGLVVVSRDFRILWANKVQEEKKGCKLEGKLCYSIFMGRDSLCPECPVEEVFKTGKDEIRREVFVEDCGGKSEWIEIFASPVKDENGKIVAAMELVIPITARKEMELKLKQYSENLEELVKKRTEELMEAELRASILLEEASVGIAVIQHDGKIVFVNKRLLQLSGYSKDEILGHHYEEFVDKKYHDFALNLFQKKLQGMPPLLTEIELIDKNGERIPVEMSGSLIRYKGYPAIVVIFRDIRERKLLQKQLLEIERLKAICDLALIVGHDLRNPLQAIANAAYIIRKEISNDKISERIMQALKVIQDSIQYSDKILRDLRDFAMTEPPKLEKLDINALVNEALAQIEVPTNIEVITKLGNVPKIYADKYMLKKIFVNLFINGIQAMEKNGGILSVSTRKRGGFIEITFEDTGVGIPEENLKKLFTSIFTTKAKGMGIGLLICKKFAESHGGSIHVKSTVGKRSTFTVKLPIKNKDLGGEKPYG
jgi:histidine kinase